jgi:hypothetical protein
VPDPFGTHESFGHHNNAMLRRFLDTFGFEYEFISATEFYARASSTRSCCRAAERYDAIMKVMLKSLREERQQTYSIFLPIHPETGRVLYVPMKHVDAKTAHDHLRRRGRARMDAAGHRRQREAAVEARFRRALGRARRRFRDVRQGPFHQHADLRRDLPRSSARARPSISPMSCSSTRRAEDLEVEGQRDLDRRMADLCLDREPELFHVPEAQDGQAAAFRRDPQGGGRVSPAAARLSRQDAAQRWRTRSGTSTAACAGLDDGRAFAMLLNLASVASCR